MKKFKVLIWVLFSVGAYVFSGCYTQVKLEDDEYSYQRDRERVIIEKRIEKDGEKEIVTVDTIYESTDDRVYEEEEYNYYYPRHRRSYKYYHPGITVVVGGSVYYDPWYFDYYYYPYPYVVCRTYYLPWWYGYYRCYRVWHGIAYYDPYFYYHPPYWWYDPYWHGGYYPPIYQYRKNDYTRLRDQDGGRSRSIGTGNWGRDLNLQTASERSRLRDGGRSGDMDRRTSPTSLDRERKSDRRDEQRTPTLRDRSGTRDRDINTRTPDRTREPSIDRERRDERRQQTPTERRIPDRSRDTGRDRNSDRSRENPDRREAPDRKDTPSRRQLDTSIPNLEQKIIIERSEERTPRQDQPTSRNYERTRIYRDERPRIEYEIPRREYQPRLDNQSSRDRNQQSNKNQSPQRNPSYDRSRTETPRYETPRHETPRYEAPRYETPRYEAPRYETPSRNTVPSYTPPPRTSTPQQIPDPLNERRRDQ